MPPLYEPTLEELVAGPILFEARRPASTFSDLVYDVSLSRPRFAGQKVRGATTAHKMGLRYERAAKRFLAGQVPGFQDGTWFGYRTLRDHQLHFCQPDGHVFEKASGGLTIFEIKYRWDHRAAPQLRKYSDVLGLHYSASSIRCICVTRAFDPAVRYEGKHEFMDTLESRVSGGAIGVFIWRP